MTRDPSPGPASRLAPRLLLTMLLLVGLVAVGLAIWLGPRIFNSGGAGSDFASGEVITNSVGLKLNLIQPGKFQMGTAGDTDMGDEFQHPVEITRAFYLGVYPVTRGQFAAFVADDSYKTEAEQAGHNRTWRTPGDLVPDKDYIQTDDDPVVEVSWNDAVKYCEWLSKKEKKTYELPTEAEWEYACRAGTTTAYSFGADSKDLGDYAWYHENSGSHTHPVGTKKPNPWGLYDMHGNVWQWCADAYGWDYYRNSPIKDPKNTNSINTCIMRCWGFGDYPEGCRAAVRINYAPGSWDFNIGFRVALRRPEDS